MQLKVDQNIKLSSIKVMNHYSLFRKEFQKNEKKSLCNLKINRNIKPSLAQVSPGIIHSFKKLYIVPLLLSSTIFERVIPDHRSLLLTTLVITDHHPHATC